MSALRFTATLEEARAGGATVLVPPDIASALGGLKQMRVFGTLNGVEYRSSTMPYGGRGLFMGVHKATRQATGVDFGDLVQVEITRDDSPRTLELAPELEAAFAAETGAASPLRRPLILAATGSRRSNRPGEAP